jgi:hypothetical protein
MDVDPTFNPIDADIYNLRLTKAELRSYTDAKSGTEKDRVALAFTVVAHDKYSGRKIFETLFPGNFAFVVLHRLADAVGIPQVGGMEDWLAELTQTQPVVKVSVSKVPDGKTFKDGTFVPNPKTVRPDGTPSDTNRIEWKAGIQPGDVQ